MQKLNVPESRFSSLRIFKKQKQKYMYELQYGKYSYKKIQKQTGSVNIVVYP
jgi:hypothetical protein